MSLPRIRFNREDGSLAHKHWGFNCGPAAICALLEMTPKELLPFLKGFKKRGYLNEKHMCSALNFIGYHYTCRKCDRGNMIDFPQFGLARIQWSGTWCSKKIPGRNANRLTHWIAAVKRESNDQGNFPVFDVNTFNVDWISFTDWSGVVVPHILKNIDGSDGCWWITHSIEL